MKEQLEQHVGKVRELYHLCEDNEATTKASLIAPLFSILGFDLSNPRECLSEYRADFGRGEKAATPADWAFKINDTFTFIVEAKRAGKKLTPYAEQLGMYFAKALVNLGIYTNGIQWQFYSDIDHANIMDKEPFLTWNVLTDSLMPMDFLTILHRSRIDAQNIRTFARRGRRQSLLVSELTSLLEPSADFVRLAVRKFETRNLGASIVEEWKPILASAIDEWAKQKALSMAMAGPPEGKSSKEVPDGGIHESEIEDDTDERQSCTLADLINSGTMQAPMRLFKTYKGTALEAALDIAGTVTFQGETFATCSAAAEMARKIATGERKNTNGWTFWQYVDSAGETRKLADAREHYRAKVAGQ